MRGKNPHLPRVHRHSSSLRGPGGESQTNFLLFQIGKFSFLFFFFLKKRRATGILSSGGLFQQTKSNVLAFMKAMESIVPQLLFCSCTVSKKKFYLAFGRPGREILKKRCKIMIISLLNYEDNNYLWVYFSFIFFNFFLTFLDSSRLFG